MLEAETCREYVIPKLEAMGWGDDAHPIQEQAVLTAGRIIVRGQRTERESEKRADYLLRYSRDFPIAVVEAKRENRRPGDGLQQAMNYAEMLGLWFAYATNGNGIVEFDYTTGAIRELDDFPSPAELWQRWREAAGFTESEDDRLLEPFDLTSGRRPRYYQEIAINATVQAILRGQQRLLLTMATGTGKTATAFQICWKLWKGRWTRDGRPGRPKILYLADRKVLISEPKRDEFAPFGEAMTRISGGSASTNRDIYFSTYQTLLPDGGRPFYRQYPRDFFDLVIVDECHRGSANANGLWREILAWFDPAHQVGMTATPRRAESADTYAYFGEPIYTYSLRQGIEDGFLAPYRVRRVVADIDATGWRPIAGQTDRYGNEIPDKEYQTPDFERRLVIPERTEAYARHLTKHLAATSRFDKTMVFCVDQEHALAMQAALDNLNADLAMRYADFVCRVTADEGDIGEGHLDHFCDIERTTPVILTTSQMLTTGIDAPSVRNIVIFRQVSSMSEFKQIIGRGTRVNEDTGKYFFTILDYTGAATRLFADPEFDGDPVMATREQIDSAGETVGPVAVESGTMDDLAHQPVPVRLVAEDDRPRKFYLDGGAIEIAAEAEFALDEQGRRLRIVEVTTWAADAVRTVFPNEATFRAAMADPARHQEIADALSTQDLDLATLATRLNQPDADPFDLLCSLAFSAPSRTRRERADAVRRDHAALLATYGDAGRDILNDLLERYAAYGLGEMRLPDALQVRPLNQRGTVSEISRIFGGTARLREAVDGLTRLLYAA